MHIIGVHTGGDGRKNYGTYFRDLLGLRDLFKEDVYLYGAYSKFDSFV
jgi:hypothetical protein